jgi:hypothetical protein
MTSIDLDNVTDFGGIDADNDPLLDSCFQTHKAYIDARSHAKTVILGRKGSGKTAIFRQFKKISDANTYSAGHVFSDYPWHYHARQKQIGVPEEHCFVNSWEYLIYIALAKVIFTIDDSQPWSNAAMENMVMLGDFIRDTYGSTNPELNKIFSPTMTLKMKGEFGIDWKIFHGKISGDVVPMEYLPIVVSSINERLREVITECANPDRHYFVCFDELDLGFSLDSGEYRSQLTGLIVAARKINTFARQSGKSLSVIIFLRDDIYQMLHFEDKNKTTGSSVSMIEWDVEKDGPSLKALAEKRFQETLGIPEKGSWEAVFDESKEMTGHQTKYSHIIDRTFLRPRDIIQFLNEILRVHRINHPEPGIRFDNKDIIDARARYSQYLLNELDDEIRKHHPNYETYMDIFRIVGSLQFTLEDLDSACLQRPDLDLKGTTARQMLSQLFEFSVVGFYKPGRAGYGGADYVWRHKDRRIRFNENATSFRIHPGFMEGLGLKKFTRSS